MTSDHYDLKDDGASFIVDRGQENELYLCKTIYSQVCGGIENSN